MLCCGVLFCGVFVGKKKIFGVVLWGAMQSVLNCVGVAELVKKHIINAWFIQPSWNPPSKVEEPLDAAQDCLSPVPVLTASYHDPDATTELKPWPGYMISKDKIPMYQEISHKILRTNAILDQTREAPTPLPSQGGQSFHSDIEEALLGAIIIT